MNLILVNETHRFSRQLELNKLKNAGSGGSLKGVWSFLYGMTECCAGFGFSDHIQIQTVSRIRFPISISIYFGFFYSFNVQASHGRASRYQYNALTISVCRRFR